MLRYFFGPSAVKCIFFSIIWLVAQGGFSQAQDISSREAANSAISTLARGDRIGALAMALASVPENSGEAAPEVIEALWRALHSRSQILDENRPLNVAVDPTGTRMLVASAEGFTGDLASHTPARLIDLSTGDVLGQPIPATEIDSELQMRTPISIGFSPDGRFAFIMVLSRDAVILLDAKTGERHAVLEAPGQDFGMATLVFPAGFSPDSTRFAAGSPFGVFVWDSASGQLLQQVPVPSLTSGELIMPAGWGSDGEIYGFKTDQQNGSKLVVIKNNAIQVLNDNLPAPAFVLRVADSGAAIAALSSSETTIFDTNGTVTASLPPSDFARFVRGGSAVAIFDVTEMQSIGSASARVFTLDGQALTPLPTDYGGFDHHVFSSDGVYLGSASFLTSATYRGQAFQNTDALIAAARAALPTGDKVEKPADTTPKSDNVPESVLASREFARLADKALSTGDRVGAIIAALKGLPGEPTERDFEIFSEAHLMLFRAVAARVLRVDLENPAGAAVDPTGQRMVIAAYQPDVAIGPVGLHDTQDGKRISDLTLPSGELVKIHPSNHSPQFSPDGQTLAIMPSTGGAIHLFNGQTGAYLRPLILLGATDKPSYGFADIGFSPDGGRYAAVSDGRLYIHDVSTGELLVQQQLPSEYYTGPVGWGAQANLYFSHRERGDNPGTKILRRDKNGVFNEHFEVLDTQGRAATSVIFAEISSQSSAIKVFTQDSAWTIYDASGAKKSVIRAPDTPRFIRDGTALAFWADSTGGGKTLSVQDLAGMRLDPDFEDYVPFDQRVFNAEGSDMTFGTPLASAPIWRAKGQQSGRELYDFVWQALPQSIRDEISQQRVDRLQ